VAVRAYVLIETQGGKAKQVIEAIRKIEGVVSVDVVTGPYDVIALIQAETFDDIGDLIVANMHPVNGISRTVTCLVVV
jgi:DNA-binding Lrp family transcriptional regulator